MNDELKAPERIWIDNERPYGGECHLFTEADVDPGIPLSDYGVEYIRADRIEQLERERDEAQINHAAWKLEAEATQANLAKAMEALRLISQMHGYTSRQLSDLARAALAELGGGE